MSNFSEICIDENTNNQYKRDITYEKKLESIVNNAKNYIVDSVKNERKIMPNNNSIFASKKDSFLVNHYNPFLWLTSEEIIRKSTTEKLFINEKTIGFTKVNASNEFDKYTSSSSNCKVINIIGFGKSLEYLLKYILFHVNYKYKNATILFMIFCDNESFDSYKNNTNIPIDETTYFSEDIKLFSDKINNPINQIDLRVLGEFIQIYFIYSDHYLMKGIGGKRAAIQYYNYTYLSKNDTNYKCMTIDDNITSIVKIEKDCRFQDAYKAKILSEKCETIQLMDIYDFLVHKTKEHILFSGINKGKGTRGERDTNDTDVDSVAIYKLNMSRPVELYKNQYFYNPFFTSFFEDMAFNYTLLLNKQSYKSLAYHIRFGHQSSNSTKKGRDDYEDTFENVNSINITGVLPVFLMYLLYFVGLYDLKDTKFLSISYDNDTEEPFFAFFTRKPYQLQSDSKYLKYQIPFFIYSALYCFSQNRIEFILCDRNNRNINTDYLKLYNYLVNKKIYYEYLDEDDNTKIYNFNHLDTAINTLEIEFKYLNNMYIGELDDAEKMEIKHNTQNLIDKISNTTIRTKYDGINATNIMNATKKRKRSVLNSKSKSKSKSNRGIVTNATRRVEFKSKSKSKSKSKYIKVDPRSKSRSRSKSVYKTSRRTKL